MWIFGGFCFACPSLMMPLNSIAVTHLSFFYPLKNTRKFLVLLTCFTKDLIFLCESWKLCLFVENLFFKNWHLNFLHLSSYFLICFLCKYLLLIYFHNGSTCVVLTVRTWNLHPQNIQRSKQKILWVRSWYACVFVTSSLMWFCGSEKHILVFSEWFSYQSWMSSSSVLLCEQVPGTQVACSP